MLTKAIARYIRVSPRKARLVADRRTFSICRAATCGEYCRIASASATVLPRTRSAIANAEHNHQVRSLDDLRVNPVIDGGPLPAAGSA